MKTRETPERKVTDVTLFLRQLRRHYTFLDVKNDNEFFRLLGIAKGAQFNWYNNGVRKIYFFILFLLNKIEKEKILNKKLQKEIDVLKKANPQS